MRVSKRRQPEEESNSELQALLSAAVDGIVIIDPQGSIEAFNASSERLFGYQADEVIGKQVDILMPEPHRSSHSSYIKNFLTTRRAKVIGTGREVEGLRKDGTRFPIWLSIGEARKADESFFVGFIRDLTVQRSAERKQAELESRLAHVARFSLMGEMAAGIAHEINQPLSAIATYAQAGGRLLDSDNFSKDELKKICSRVTEQGHRAASVIENLRNFIRKQEPGKEIICLNDIIQDVVGLIAVDAKNADIALTLEYSEDLPPIYGNAVQIQQVVLNLTRNAVDAMRALRKDKREKGIVIRTDKLIDGGVGVKVTDHGPGVAKGLNDAVFHPFVSTKNDGLGVGLAISRTIVESHSGKLRYRGNPMGGAIFEADFPAAVQGANNE